MGVTFDLDLAATGTVVAVGDRGGFRAAAAGLGTTTAGVSDEARPGLQFGTDPVYNCSRQRGGRVPRPLETVP